MSLVAWTPPQPAVSRPPLPPGAFAAPNWATRPAGFAPWLDVHRDENGERVRVERKPLSAHSAWLVGRDTAKCNLPVEHASVSRSHACLVHADDGTTYLADLDSAHGTRLSDSADAEPVKLTPLELVPLRTGCVIRFGHSSRRFTYLAYVAGVAGGGGGGDDGARKRSRPEAPTAAAVNVAAAVAAAAAAAAAAPARPARVSKFQDAAGPVAAEAAASAAAALAPPLQPAAPTAFASHFAGAAASKLTAATTTTAVQRKPASAAAKAAAARRRAAAAGGGAARAKRHQALLTVDAAAVAPLPKAEEAPAAYAEPDAPDDSQIVYE